MDRKTLIKYYNSLVDKYPDKEDLIYDGMEAIHAGGVLTDHFPDIDTVISAGERARGRGPSEISKGFEKATKEMKASGYGAVGLVGSAVGSDKLRDYGYEGYKRNMAEAEEVAPRVNKVEDIGSFSDAKDWFMGTLGSLGPSVIEAGAFALAGGGVGGLAAKRVGKEAVETAVEKYVAMRVAEGATEAAAREAAAGMVGKFAKSIASGYGRKTGLVAGVAPVESGSMFGQSADEVGVENVNPYVTGLMGTISAASELAGPEGELLTNGIKKFGRGTIVTDLVKSAAKEGGQEVLQQGLGDVNRLVNNPDATLSGSDYLNAAAAGLVGGFTFGAPSAARGLMSPKAPQDIIKSAKGEAAPVETSVVDESPVVDGQSVEPNIVPLPRSPLPGMGVVKSKDIEPLPGMGIFNQETPMASGLQVNPNVAPVESVQPLPVEEQPAVNAGLQTEPEPIQEPDVLNVRAEATLDDGIKYTYGENKAGKPSIFAHDQAGKLLDAVVYKNHEIASNEFLKLTEPVQEVAPVEQPLVPAMGLQAMPKAESKKPVVPAKGLSLDQDEYGGMGLPVYESKGVINETEKAKEEKTGVALSGKEKAETTKGVNATSIDGMSANEIESLHTSQRKTVESLIKDKPIEFQKKIRKTLGILHKNQKRAVAFTSFIKNKPTELYNKPDNSILQNGMETIAGRQINEFFQKLSDGSFDVKNQDIEPQNDNLTSESVKHPSIDRKPYMDFVEKKVKELGSSEAVNDFYKTDKPVDQYARDYAKSVYGEAKKPVKEPFNAPEGVKLTSTGGPFKISGAKKAVANHTKATGEAAEVVDLGGGNFGWKVSEKKETPVVVNETPVDETQTDLTLKDEHQSVHDYSSTQVNIKGEAAKKIIDFGNKIPESELYTDPKDPSYGRETQPHITARYGLATDNPGEISDLSKMGPIKARIGKVSVFENDKYDVVKADIDSDSMRAVNKKIGELVDVPGETFKDYQPHATIAFVKKGEGKKYIGDNSLEGTELTFNEISLIDRQGNAHQIGLKGKAENNDPAASESSATKGVVFEKEPPISKTETTEPKTDQPSVETVTDPVKAESSQTPDRRQDTDRRKTVSEMSPEEMKRELLTDYLTGLGNKRAYEESEKKAHQVSIDADALKWVNDNLGHQTGDKLLKKIGEALKQEGLEAYHISGDEYYIQSDSDVFLEDAVKKAYSYLKENPINIALPDGTKALFTGGFSYGRGQNIEEAETRLQLHKTERELSGSRSVRGAEPSGSIRKISEGDQDNSGRGRGDLEGQVTAEKPSEKSAENQPIESRIADAEKAGIVLSYADKAEIKRLYTESLEARKKADRLSVSSSDPMNKGNAFPLGVGYTKMTKRKERAIDTSVINAGKAVRLYGKSEAYKERLNKMLLGIGTESYNAKKNQSEIEGKAAAKEKERKLKREQNRLPIINVKEGADKEMTFKEWSDTHSDYKAVTVHQDGKYRYRSVMAGSVFLTDRPVVTADDVIDVKTSGKNAEVSVDIPKNEKANLSPKEQKEYLLKEIDAAIKNAPDEQVYKSDSSKREDILAVYEGNKAEFGVVEIHVPGDGSYTILNTKSSLEDFKKRANGFPVSELRPVDRSKVSVPRPKRPEGLEGEYIKDPYKPYSKTLEIKKGDKKWFKQDGYSSNGGIIIKGDVKGTPSIERDPGSVKRIINSLVIGKKAEDITEHYDSNGYHSSFIFVEAGGDQGIFNSDYFDAVLTRYKNADIFLGKAGPYESAIFKDGDEVVAVIAGLKPFSGDETTLGTIEEATKKRDSFRNSRNGKQGDGDKKQDAVDQENKGGEESAPYSIKTHFDSIKKLRSGSLTAEELKTAFKTFIENKDKIQEELSQKTMKQLAPNGSRYKKPELIKAIISDMGMAYHVADSFSYVFGQNPDKVLADKVEAQTQADIDAYLERIGKRKAEREKDLEGIKNPKTLGDFRRYIESKMEQGVTRKEAFSSLTAEQVEEYDNLEAETTRSAREAQKESEKTRIASASQEVSGDVIETKHTKTGEPLFVVKPDERVDREIYNQWNTTAKRMGGHYSSYRANGAVPGFQFKTRESADAFLGYLKGDTEGAKNVVSERYDAFSDNKSQTAVERLREMADRLETNADERMNADRKTNTARRARMASGIEAAASRAIAFARTMRNIAEAIERDETKFLDRVRTKTQVDQLFSSLSQAKYEAFRKSDQYNRVDYSEFSRSMTPQEAKSAAKYVTYPRYTAMQSDLARMGRQLSALDGTKKLGERLLKIADDVTDEYMKFAKENLHSVSTFKKDDGTMAVFASKEMADRAISRSGFKGKAIPISFKRGQHLIIMGPEMAKEKGVWKNDIDKKITLTPEFVEEIISKADRKGRNSITIPWTFGSVKDQRKRLKAMGIETDSELRSAIRELVTLAEAPKEQDKIKQLERAMVGLKNDGLDFFPTAPETVSSMLDIAGIEEGMKVLEPSAGMGHIADAIRETGVEPDVIEMSAERKELLEAKGFNVIGRDFMDETEGGYDRIIMNPPFSNRRDAEHVRHAYGLLGKDGRVVAIMGEGVFFGQDKKATEFRDWLESVGGTSEKLPEGSFKDPSLPVNTSVNARMVVIDKADGVQSVDDGDIKFSKSTPTGPTATISELSKPQRAEVEKLQKAGRVTMATEQEAIEAMKQAGLSAERAKYMVAYHGTPHDFDQFSMDKIGTGEGAQAYGYGLYFAENKDIAEHYKNVLGYKEVVKQFTNELPEDADFEDVMSLVDDGTFKGRKAELLKALNNDDWLGFDYPSQAISAAFKEIDAYDASPELKKAVKDFSRLYQVELAPKDDEYLLWDKSLSEQGEKIDKAINFFIKSEIDRLGTDEKQILKRYPSGQAVYRQLLAQKNDKKAVSDYLRSIGIRGIKYLDGSSRGKGEGSYNYVIFDDADVKITAKYSKDGKIQGFVLPDGKAYIIPENIQQGNLWNVIRHEIGVHMGQLMQGRPEFNRILKTLENLKKSDTKQGELVRKAFERVPKDTKPEHIAEEALAYLVESAPEIGIVRRFITMVKRLLVKMGVSPMIFNQADYAALADAAIRKEADRAPGAGKTIGETRKRFMESRNGNSKDTVLDLESIKEKWADVVDALYITERRDGTISVDSLIVKKDARGNGNGTAIMNDIIAYADKTGKRITLSPGQKDDRHGTTSRARLVKFYKKLGLIENKGRNKDFTMSAGMFRNPREPLYSISDAKDYFKESIDDALEFSKDLYERKGEILSGAKATLKYRKDKGKNFKEDTTWIEKSFGLVSHYAKKIPAFARTFNAALRNGELKTMIEQHLTHGADGERFIETINNFRRKFKSEYRKLDRYLHDRDLNQVGYRVKTVDPDQIAEMGGKFIIVNLEGKDTRLVFESKREAFEKITDLEVEDYINDGNSQESARALRLFRTINNRSFDMRIARLEEIEKFCEENGIKLPDEVIVEGETIKVDLKAALIKMGDRRGYYMPRIRNKGEWVVYASKEGENPRTEYFDLKLRADFRRGQLENNGYRVTVKKAGNLSEDLFEQLGSVLSQQAIINESMEEINKGNKVVTLKDLDIKSWMDGDDLVMSGEFMDEYLPTLDKFEGEKKVKESYVGKAKVVTIEYRFKNAKKGLEEEISKELFKISGATNMFQEVATRFAKAFVSQYADVIRSRGSRSAMIGRSDKVGQEVNLGFEEDALTRVVRATLSLAGGEAKSRTALSMIETISGRDVSWSKFSEIKRFKGTFEEFEKQVIDNDEQYIDRATFDEIKNNWVGAPQYPDYIEFVEGRGIDPALQKTAHAEAMALFKDMMRNDERADRVIGTLKGLAVLKYLGFRVASPVANMTNMVVGVPGAMAGYGKIPIRQAMKHIGKSFAEYRQFKKGELKNNTLKKVFEEIEKRGWDQAQFNHEGMAALQNKMQFGYAKIIETSMMMFTWSEKQNRVATISAAYKGLQTSFPDLTFEERLLKAKEISDKAHGIYGKANRPSVVRGGSVGANILQMGYVFKTFTHNFLATMADLAINERDRKAVAWLLFSPAMFGMGASMGAKGLISAIGWGLSSDDPEEDFYKWVESIFGSYTENLARFGVFGALGDGISVKGSLNSIGVSDLPTSFKDLIGAPGSVLTDVIGGVGQIGRGNVMKGAESILPLAFGAPVKAYREYTEGITTKSNAPVFFEGKPLKADAIDAFLRALSFNPSRIAGAREKLRGEKVSEQAFMERRKDIYSRVKKYYLDTDRDPEDLQDIEIDIAAYNQRAKNSGQTVIKAKNIKSILKRAKIEE